MEQNAQFYFERGINKIQNRDLEDGFADLDQAVQLDPDNVSYYWFRGFSRYTHSALQVGESYEDHALRSQNYLQLALLDFTKTIELASDDNRIADAYRKRIACYQMLNQYDNLIADTNWLIEHGRGDANTYEAQGLYWVKQSQFDEALQAYTKAVELWPDYRFVLGRGNIYFKLGRYAEAVADYTQVLGLTDDTHPHRFMFYQHRAWAYYRLGKLDLSLDDFNQAYSNDGQKPLASLDEYLSQTSEPKI